MVGRSHSVLEDGGKQKYGSILLQTERHHQVFSAAKRPGSQRGGLGPPGALSGTKHGLRVVPPATERHKHTSKL